ncbi:MAG: hypothetical protein QMD11_03385 [Smithella sp.]|nr:hypothetical protein [Smithella sp.]
MKLIPRILAVLIMVTAITFSVQGEIVQKPFGGSPWTPFPGDFPLIPALPDTFSRYDTFVFKQHTGDFDYLKITGKFPHSRYFSFNLTDFIMGNAISAIADIEIEADPGHTNPFDPALSRDAIHRSFTLYLVKDGVTPPRGAINVMLLPPDVETLGFFTRVFRPDRGYNSLGGVDLPRIEALKADGSSAEIPEFGLDAQALLRMAPLFILNKELLEAHRVARQFAGDLVTFYQASCTNLFPNVHNKYLTSYLPEDYINKVAVITLTPPTTEDTYTGGPFVGNKDVRYWSVCMCGLGETRTSNCLADDQIRKNHDGTATVIIAPLYLKGAIEAKGFNFLRWGALYKPIMLYRQMLANDDFEGRIKDNVIPIDRVLAPEDQTQAYFDAHAAQNFMGEYAPAGRVFTILNFQRWLRKQ